MKLNRLVSTSGMDHATWLEYRKRESVDQMRAVSVA